MTELPKIDPGATVGTAIGQSLGKAAVAHTEYQGEIRVDENQLDAIGLELLHFLAPRLLEPKRSKGEKIVADCLANDEPFFVFRARDIFSPMVLKHYIKILEDYGPDDPDFQANIVQFINQLRKWQTQNVADVRYPD